MTAQAPSRRGERTLVLLRHAKSDWGTGDPDHERPLSPRGRRQAPEAGGWLAEHVDLDLAVVSSAVRTLETWDLVSAELAGDCPTDVDDRLYAASAYQLLETVRGLPERARAVVLVAHNPGLEDLVGLLTGSVVELKTSGIAVLALPSSWGEAGREVARLVAHGRPPG